jgi:hypothetical protein
MKDEGISEVMLSSRAFCNRAINYLNWNGRKNKLSSIRDDGSSKVVAMQHK